MSDGTSDHWNLIWTTPQTWGKSPRKPHSSTQKCFFSAIVICDKRSFSQIPPMTRFWNSVSWILSYRQHWTVVSCLSVVIGFNKMQYFPLIIHNESHCIQCKIAQNFQKRGIKLTQLCAISNTQVILMLLPVTPTKH